MAECRVRTGHNSSHLWALNLGGWGRRTTMSPRLFELHTKLQVNLVYKERHLGILSHIEGWLAWVLCTFKSSFAARVRFACSDSEAASLSGWNIWFSLLPCGSWRNHDSSDKSFIELICLWAWTHVKDWLWSSHPFLEMKLRMSLCFPVCKFLCWHWDPENKLPDMSCSVFRAMLYTFHSF